MYKHTSIFGIDPATDGTEVKTIRRETVNEFADWQELGENGFPGQNNAIASPQTDDQKPFGLPVCELSEGHKGLHVRITPEGYADLWTGYARHEVSN